MTVAIWQKVNWQARAALHLLRRAGRIRGAAATRTAAASLRGALMGQPHAPHVLSGHLALLLAANLQMTRRCSDALAKLSSITDACVSKDAMCT